MFSPQVALCRCITVHQLGWLVQDNIIATNPVSYLLRTTTLADQTASITCRQTASNNSEHTIGNFTQKKHHEWVLEWWDQCYCKLCAISVCLGSGVFTAHAMREHRNPPTLHFSLLNSTSDWTSLCLSQWIPMSPLPLVRRPFHHSFNYLCFIPLSRCRVTAWDF